MADDVRISYVLNLHTPDGRQPRTIAKDTPAALARAAHEIMTRGAEGELDDDVDRYTGSDGTDYADAEFSFIRLEQHRLTDAEIREVEAEIARLDSATDQDSLLSKTRRARGNEGPPGEAS